jgi:hypothetical protein
MLELRPNQHDGQSFNSNMPFYYFIGSVTAELSVLFKVLSNPIHGKFVFLLMNEPKQSFSLVLKGAPGLEFTSPFENPCDIAKIFPKNSSRYGLNSNYIHYFLQPDGSLKINVEVTNFIVTLIYLAI